MRLLSVEDVEKLRKNPFSMNVLNVIYTLKAALNVVDAAKDLQDLPSHPHLSDSLKPFQQGGGA